MSDDLVNKLYDRRVCSPAQNSCRNDWVINQAADRIKELEAENKRLRLEVAHANDTTDAAIEGTKELEAKLAKAVARAEVADETLDKAIDASRVLIAKMKDRTDDQWRREIRGKANRGETDE